eukprot:scaffold25049_cov127-Cylindrotheca_fusiformis.AAC.3
MEGKRKSHTITSKSVRESQYVSIMKRTLFLLALVSVQGKPVRPRHCGGDVKHIHLAVGLDPSREMTVSFASKWSVPGVLAPIGGVHIGLAPNKLDRFVPEQEHPIRYETTSHHMNGVMYYSPFQHHITIDNLEPNTTYYYVPVDGSRENGVEGLASKPIRAENSGVESAFLNETKEEERGRLRESRRLAPAPYDGSNKPCAESSRVRSFTTAPDSSDAPVTFAIVGDLGQFGHSEETLENMRKHRDGIDAVVLVGDVAYTDLDHRRWDTFFDFLDDFSIFDEVPLQIATGNHDIEKQENGTDIFQAYETRFRMPQVRPAQLSSFEFPGYLNMDTPPYPLPYDWGNAYYSFNYGPAKHIIVSAYSSMEPDSAQYEWLVKELKSVDRKITPWVLLSIHTPLYNTFHKHKHDAQILAAQQHLEPLIVQHHVNVVFTGHIHAYQRTKNVAMGKPDRKGPMHVTVGAGGRQCNAEYENESQEEWIEHRDSSFFGYGRFSIFNSTHAKWRWIPLSPSGKAKYCVFLARSCFFVLHANIPVAYHREASL